MTAARETVHLFETAPATGTRGLGALWLAEAVGILRAHSGSLDVESGPHGTTMHAYLPTP
jgi:nitrogen-specific signal transduction histidine kinase